MYWKSALLAIVLLLQTSTGGAAQPDYLRLGLFPYVNPTTLIQHHKAFIEYLQAETGLKIQIVTSPDFKTFLERTRNNEFDLVLTAPHFGRLAEVRDGYQRIAMTKHHVQGIYIVKADSPIDNLKQLKGKRITVAEPTSLLFKMTVQQLKTEYGYTIRQQAESNRYIDSNAVTIIPTGTHNNAMFAVLKAESDVAVTGIQLYLSYIKKNPGVLKKIGATWAVPGFMFMANKNVPRVEVLALRKAALSFGNTEMGQRYIFKGYTEIDDKTMKSMDVYIKDLR